MRDSAKRLNCKDLSFCLEVLLFAGTVRIDSCFSRCQVDLGVEFGGQYQSPWGRLASRAQEALYTTHRVLGESRTFDSSPKNEESEIVTTFG
jgi:hypothetical protein